MRVIVIGIGDVGRTAVRSLHEAHACTVVDVDGARLDAIADAMDVRVVQGSGARSEVLHQAGIAEAELVLACTSRDEVNLVAAMLARRMSDARTVVRVTEADHLAAWRDGDLDVDSIVSSERETANAVARVLAVPGARHADAFAAGDVQVVAFDVPPSAPPPICGRPLGHAGLPAESRVVSILRDDEHLVPDAETAIAPGDRVVVMASRAAARRWSDLFTPDEPARDVAVFGAGRAGMAIARALVDRDVRVKVVEADARAARAAADALPGARVFHATGLDDELLVRERFDRVRAAVVALGDDARSLYAATLAKVHGVRFTMAVLARPEAAPVFDAAGVDATIDPADETAEVMVRFALDPRTRQVAMLEDDRFEVVDVAIPADSPLAGRRLDDLRHALGAVGAIVRDGRAVFGDGDEALRGGDRAIVLAEASRVDELLRSL